MANLEKFKAELEEYKGKLKNKSAALNQVLGGTSQLPAPVLPVVSVGAAAVTGRLDGRLGTEAMPHPTAYLAMAAGVATAIGGAVTKKPEVTAVGLAAAAGPAAGLTYGYQYQKGMASKLEAAAKAAQAQAGQQQQSAPNPQPPQK